jgi:putative membrane protein
MLTALAATTPPWGYGPGFPFFFLVPLVWLIVLVLIGVLVARSRRRFWAENGGPSFGAHRSPESTLSERFANGEIDEVEYRSRLEVLRANRPAPRR